MFSIKRLCAILILLPVAVLLVPMSALGQIKVGGLFGTNTMTVCNSPRAIGMGGCSALLSDAQSSMYNPGSAGIFYMDNKITLALPNNNSLNLRYIDDYYGRSFGCGFRILNRSINDNTKLYWSAAYSQNVLVLEDIPTLDYDLNEYMVTISYATRALTTAIGLQSKSIRIGFGLSGKYFSLDNSDADVKSAVAFDVGMLAEWIVLNAAANGESAENNHEIKASAAITHNNIGDEFEYYDWSYNIPTSVSMGGGLSYGLYSNNKKIFSVNPVIEFRKYTFSAPIVDEWITRYGGEIGVADMLFGRIGKVESFDDLSWGFGFSLMETLRNLKVIKTGSDENLMKNLDITFDYAYSDDNYFNDTKYWQVNILLH